MLRSGLIALSQNASLRQVMEQTTPGRRISSRFVAGLTIEDALEATHVLNGEGFSVSMDSLGESVSSEAQIYAAASLYHRLLDEISTKQLDANVSLKLTGVGMDIAPELAERITSEIVEHASGNRNFVRIDMEGSPYTQATVEMTERLHSRYPGAVGTVLQAYLYRSAEDTARLLQQGIRIRLCKGAYKEAAEIAIPQKRDVDANYIRLMQTMIASGVYCGIETHDEAMIAAAEQFSRTHGISPDAFEFQMLYGVRRDLQRDLLGRGYRVRVYLPFGTDWYPYFMRRLAERPANVLFIAKNLFRN